MNCVCTPGRLPWNLRIDPWTGKSSSKPSFPGSMLIFGSTLKFPWQKRPGRCPGAPWQEYPPSFVRRPRRSFPPGETPVNQLVKPWELSHIPLESHGGTGRRSKLSYWVGFGNVSEGKLCATSVPGIFEDDVGYVITFLEGFFRMWSITWTSLNYIAKWLADQKIAASETQHSCKLVKMNCLFKAPAFCNFSGLLLAVGLAGFGPKSPERIQLGQLGVRGMIWVFVPCSSGPGFPPKKINKNKIQATHTTSWWLNQPVWKKNVSQIGSFPQVGIKLKNVWNHHLDKQPGLWTFFLTWQNNNINAAAKNDSQPFFWHSNLE